MSKHTSMSLAGFGVSLVLKNVGDVNSKKRATAGRAAANGARMKQTNAQPPGPGTGVPAGPEAHELQGSSPARMQAGEGCRVHLQGRARPRSQGGRGDQAALPCPRTPGFIRKVNHAPCTVGAKCRIQRRTRVEGWGRRAQGDEELDLRAEPEGELRKASHEEPGGHPGAGPVGSLLHRLRSLGAVHPGAASWERTAAVGSLEGGKAQGEPGAPPPRPLSADPAHRLLLLLEQSPSGLGSSSRTLGQGWFPGRESDHGRNLVAGFLVPLTRAETLPWN